MRFREHQNDARSATRRLLLLFVLAVLLTLACTNGLLALIWRLQTGGLLGYPRWFFETNTLVALGFILGGSWIETVRLRKGGAHVAHLLGAREVVRSVSLTERRVRNIVEEMAIASGLKCPRVFVLEREEAINAFAAGWEQHDSVVVVTCGALERLTRDELQGVVAHEFGHIGNGDTRLNMRLIGYVFGLQMIYNFGRRLTEPTDSHGRRSLAVLMGLALMAAGFIGWMAGRLLKAAVARQREFLADAHAVQFTRLPAGIGGALRKIDHQMRGGELHLRHPHTEVVSHLLFWGGSWDRSHWLATHPPLSERLRRIYGRAMPPLPAPVLDPVQESASAAAPGPAFVPMDVAPTLPFAVPSALMAGTSPPKCLPAAVDGSDQGASYQVGDAEQTLQRLREFTLPELLEAALLAFLVPSPDAQEHRLWRGFASGVSGADAVLQAVWQLPPRRCQAWFEHLLLLAAELPSGRQQVVCERALQIVRADGRLDLLELLMASMLLHDLSPRREPLVMEARRLSLSALGAEVALLTNALAILLPVEQAGRWSLQVLQTLGLTVPPAALDVLELASVRRAIERLRRLALTQSPALAKLWVASLPAPPMAQDLARALRMVCVLLDTPMPPQLSTRFDTLDAPRS